jgi:hypothetical protein
MARTSTFLLVYVLPAILLVGVVLAVWGVKLPWYVLWIGVPLALFCLMMLVGAIVHAREEAILRQREVSGAERTLPAAPAPESHQDKPQIEQPARLSPGPDKE